MKYHNLEKIKHLVENLTKDKYDQIQLDMQENNIGKI